MFLKISLFLVCTVFVFCESSFVDTLGKCKINDGACEKDLLQSILRDISKTGVPELGIPQIDPMILKNISLSILDVLDYTLVEGTAKGAKDCVVTRFETNIEDERAFIETVCDFSVKGHYKVFSKSPLVKSFTGGDTLTGEGNGKVKIEKLKLKMDFDFYIQRRNGELYIKCKTNKIKYTVDIGKMLFFADNFYIGKQESSTQQTLVHCHLISPIVKWGGNPDRGEIRREIHKPTFINSARRKLVTGVLNENWRILVNSFGKPFMDKAMEFLTRFIEKFFAAVPAKHYISDDLSKYARD